MTAHVQINFVFYHPYSIQDTVKQLRLITGVDKFELDVRIYYIQHF